jgi:DHA2 family multidrug resistance protein
VLVERVVNAAPATLERVNGMAAGLAARGLSPAEAHARALALLDGAVSQQAAVLSFGDTFYATSALVLLCLPLVILLGKSVRGAKPSAGH